MEYMKQYEKVNIEKKCYVYPAGGCATACVKILQDCLDGVEYVMLDDRDKKTSLDECCESVKSSGCYVLLCAGDIQDELEQKCKSYGITNIVDGRAYTGYLLAKKIREEIEIDHEMFEILDGGKFLHIFDNQWLTHFYYFYDLFLHYLEDIVLDYVCEAVREYCKCVEEKMHRNGIKLLISDIIIPYNNRLTLPISKNIEGKKKITWILHMKYYSDFKKEVKEYGFAIGAPWVLWSYFINRGVYLSLMGGEPGFRKTNAKVVGIGHTLAEVFQFLSKNLKTENLIRNIRNYFKGFHYYIAIDRRSKETYEVLFKNAELDIKVLEGGSLSLDDKIKDFNYLQYSAENFLFMPRVIDLQFVYEAIKELLKHNKKVIFRPHHARKNYINYLQTEDPYVIMNDFSNDANFVFMPRESPLTKEILAKSIVITDNSSTGFSTPLSTLHPTILFCPPKKEFDLSVKNFGISYDDPILHRVALSVDECVQKCLQLENELMGDGGMVLRENMQKYRDKILYNQGCSSEAIAKILMDITDGKI
ncbi:hypothetical protein [Helicobacter sp.]|uniref:hypothetical protein n=1 Tax=Helicobacter sp. TaxID=218 RepID=UPI00258E4DD3|nr:hypothetical protein [Helicobacter sp.]MCI7765121.1 hypothetical protein [Helicobacter sp.]